MASLVFLHIAQCALLLPPLTRARAGLTFTSFSPISKYLFDLPSYLVSSQLVGGDISISICQMGTSQIISIISCFMLSWLRISSWLVIIYLVSSEIVFISNLAHPSWAQLSVSMQGFGVEPCFDCVWKGVFYRPSQFSEPKRKAIDSQLELLFLNTSDLKQPLFSSEDVINLYYRLWR